MSRLMIAPLGARGALPSPAQTAIERMLLEEGVAIDHAGDAAEALSRVASEEHDLLILTHDDSSREAPAVARGVQALRTRAAQEGRRFVPVLVLSGAPEHAAASEARAVGADDLLPMTLGPQLACARVRAYLALSGRGLPPRQSPSASPRAPNPLRHDLTQRLVHDLRNPLAGLSSNLSYVDDRLGDQVDPEVLEALSDCRAAVGRLRRAATMLVDIGPLEDGTLKPRLSPGSLVPVMQDLFTQRRHEASLRDLKLQADIPPGLVVPFDQELLPRLLHALLDNVLRLAQTGSSVLIRAAGGERLRLIIEAAGEWLPRPDRQSTITEVGLGVYYAQVVVRAHGGTISVVGDPPEGPAKRTTAVMIL